MVFIANSELLQGRESNMSLISWHSSRLRRVARSSSAAETQAAADGDDEAVYIRVCLKEVLFGQLDLRNWQSEARQIPAALVVVVSTMPWLALRLHSNRVSLSVDQKYAGVTLQHSWVML